jgi:hypothetical protein
LQYCSGFAKLRGKIQRSPLSLSRHWSHLSTYYVIFALKIFVYEVLVLW